MDWEAITSSSALLHSLMFAGTNVAILIQCKTIFGCRHGLETLIQLTTSYSTYNAYSYGGEVLVIVTEARVVDSPAYPHRGLLLDTARNYLSVQTIERMLDGMGMTKLNVLHWHVTDTQSFPLYLPRLPQMSRYGVKLMVGRCNSLHLAQKNLSCSSPARPYPVFSLESFIYLLESGDSFSTVTRGRF